MEDVHIKPRPRFVYEKEALGNVGKRVQYTCIYAVQDLLVCGANTGSIYVFRRGVSSLYQLLKMIPPLSTDQQLTGISSISICPNTRFLVIGTARGLVYGYSLECSTARDFRQLGEKVAFSFDYHEGASITCIIWSTDGNRFFSSSQSGIVTMTSLRMGLLVSFFSSSESEILIKEETGIVQLDYYDNQSRQDQEESLLVSSQTRVLVLQLSSRSNSQPIQIGTKLRQGSYGACFFPPSSSSIDIQVLSVRPGKRVWIANGSNAGTVQSTLKFKFPAKSRPATFLSRGDKECANDHDSTANSMTSRGTTVMKSPIFTRVAFMTLYSPFDAQVATIRPCARINDHFDNHGDQLIGWSLGETGALFFMEPKTAEIIEWHQDLDVIHQIQVMENSSLLVLHGKPPKVAWIRMISSCDVFLQQFGHSTLSTKIELALTYRILDLTVLQRLLDNTDRNDEEEQEDEVLSSLVEKLQKWIEICQSRLHMIEVSKTHEQDWTSQEVQSHVQDDGSNETKIQQRPCIQISRLEDDDPVFLPSKWIEVDQYDSNEETMAENHLYQSTSFFTAPSQKISSSISSFLPARYQPQESASPSSHLLTSTVAISDVSSRDLQRYKRERALQQQQMISILPIAMSMHSFGVDSEMEILLEAIAVNISKTNLFFWIFPPTNERQQQHSQERNDDDGEDFNIRRLSVSSSLSSISSGAELTVLHGASFVETKTASADEFERSISASSDLFLMDNSGTSESMSNTHHQRPPEPPLPTILPQQPQSIEKNSFQLTMAEVHSIWSTQNHRCRSQFIHCPYLMSNFPECCSRTYEDLETELNAAAEAARKEPDLVQHIWPAAGITRTTWCLIHSDLYLGQGRFVLSLPTSPCRVKLEAWMACFHPSMDETSTRKKLSSEENDRDALSQGWSRSQALVHGNGLPLTRDNWYLVKSLVTFYFQLRIAPQLVYVTSRSKSKYIRKGNNDIPIKLKCFTPRDDRSSFSSWTTENALDFVNRFYFYLIPDQAIEVCSAIQHQQVFDSLLTLIMSNQNHASRLELIQKSFEEEASKTKSKITAMDFLVDLYQCHQTKDVSSVCYLISSLDHLFEYCSPSTMTQFCIDNFPHLRPWNLQQYVIKQHQHPFYRQWYFQYVYQLVSVHTRAMKHDVDLIMVWIELYYDLYMSSHSNESFDERHHYEHSNFHIQSSTFPDWAIDVLRGTPIVLNKCMTQWIKHGHVNMLQQMLSFGYLNVECDWSVFLPLATVATEQERQNFFRQLWTSALSHGVPSPPVFSRFYAAAPWSSTLWNQFLVYLGPRQFLDEFPTASSLHPVLLTPPQIRGDENHERQNILDLSTYKQLITQELLHQQQERIIQQMCEVVDAYCWSTSSSVSKSSADYLLEQQSFNSQCLSPQGQVIFELESTQSKRLKVLEEPSLGLELKSVAEHTKTSTSHDEEDNGKCQHSFATGHRKATISIDSMCYYCHLPLFSASIFDATALDKEKIVLLPCQHAFHTLCHGHTGTSSEDRFESALLSFEDDDDLEDCPMCIEQHFSTLFVHSLPSVSVTPKNPTIISKMLCS